MATVVVLNRASMGAGDPELGTKILGTFLRKVQGRIPDLEAIVLFNDGVKLVAPGSPVLTELRLLHEAGIDLRPCGTCVEFHGIEVAAGEVSSMDDILAEMARAAKVVTL